ncbi:hypothetical protein GTGU_01871 [Trabulsiella guamensis ATCC 49490]|uniref:DUF943 family protein n=1 Tax=Trabulsiella guamensis ATCC 49490 TaxID=1005994 RepID=A0A085AB92_9ENTR|nr:DUF943 family protein [Trabulsiella guamensis]KFC07487.1 hypothetical protein GTGU_01871 [Trabulsiella guamensis ATCC 49490]
MKNKFPVMLLCLFMIGAIYNFWTLRPVSILYVYSDGYGIVNLVVDHMPLTDRGKIGWYLAHREYIQSTYPLFPEIRHRYYVTNVGEGFTNQENSPHEDLRCFPAIDSKKNCVIKDYFLIVDENVNENTRFYVSDGEVEYQMMSEHKLEFIPRPEALQE